MPANAPVNSIEASQTPLAYKAAGIIDRATPIDAQVGVRVATRTLAGMQKEALVAQSGSDDVWRMVCDEGPYLNGTDLAPPPLAFFSAGMASSIATGILSRASGHSAEITNLKIVQDNLYSMTGSAIRGTMTAGALPVELSVSARLSGGDCTLDAIVYEALAKSPIDALMRDEMVDTFSITRNGQPLAPRKVAASTSLIPENPARLFSEQRYVEENQLLTNAISKLATTESVFEADHGKGAAMKDEQKRQLQIRSVLTARNDGLHSIDVQIFKPIGSTFNFLSDESFAPGRSGRAPSGLAYVSAGLAFCFMTQLGRYAGITKKNLASYGVIQDTAFDAEEGRTDPVDTHTYLETSEDQETTRQFVDMAEQTCFLHGACRMSNKTRVKIVSG